MTRWSAATITTPRPSNLATQYRAAWLDDQTLHPHHRPRAGHPPYTTFESAPGLLAQVEDQGQRKTGKREVASRAHSVSNYGDSHAGVSDLVSATINSEQLGLRQLGIEGDRRWPQGDAKTIHEMGYSDKIKPTWRGARHVRSDSARWTLCLRATTAPGQRGTPDPGPASQLHQDHRRGRRSRAVTTRCSASR